MERRDKIELLKLLEERRVRTGRTNFKEFVLFTKEDYSMEWFHSIVCHYLELLSDRHIKKLMIFMPPQHGKTELSSRRFPAYLLGKNPKEKIILGSYNSTKASEFVVDCNRIMKSDEYKSLYPKTELDGKDTEIYFEVNKGSGYLKGAGMDSGVTGTTASCYIIDDPFKGRITANSQNTRDKVWMTLNDDFKTRIDNNGIELMLFTRWHEDDIAGRLLNENSEFFDEEERSEWIILSFPALKEEKQFYSSAIDYDDPREIDEALWESKHSKSKYIKRRRMNPTGFASLDQQRPSAEEGNKIRREWFVIKKKKELPFNPSTVKVDYFIDGAFTENTQNDETGLLACHYHKQTDELYIFNCSGIRKELYELLPYFKSYVKSNFYSPTSSIYIELKASGHPLKSMLSKVEYGGFNARGINSKVVGLGKYNRVENSEPFIASGKVILIEGGWNATFLDQCASFPNGVHDDMVDVLTYAVHKYLIKKSSGGVSYE